MIALVDADVLGYRIAFACKDEELSVAKHRLNGFIADILTHEVDTVYDGCFVDSWKLFLTGKNNFRHKLATIAPYKGNRTAPKPAHLPALRKHLVDEWKAEIVDGQEADDAIAIEATALGDSCVMVSVDKDFDQIPGWHYNFVKKLGYYVTPKQGLYSFYKQLLTGDSADNIMGLKGIGNVKAEKILSAVDISQMPLDAVNEALYELCFTAYEENDEELIETARLLWLRRKPDELWMPPLKDNQ